jgi:recombination associated protein RdgC
MTQFIKATRIFSAALPSAEALRGHLTNETFAEPLATQLSTCGFVPMEQGTFVTEFPGGFAFRFRYAQKVIPASVIKQAMADAVREIENETGRKPGKKEKADIKASLIEDFSARAFVRTTDIICYFRSATNHLLVPTLSTSIGDKLMTKLVFAVESLKTETIHVSNVTQGLTARLKRWLDDGDAFDAFGAFYPVNEVDLEQEEHSVRVKMTGLQQAHKALTTSLNQGFSVSAIGLNLEGDEFKLTHNFNLRAIKLADPEQEEQLEEEPTFEAQAAIEVDRIGLIVDQLVGMFAYQEAESQEDVQVP